MEFVCGVLGLVCVYVCGCGGWVGVLRGVFVLVWGVFLFLFWCGLSVLRGVFVVVFCFVWVFVELPTKKTEDRKDAQPRTYHLELREQADVLVLGGVVHGDAAAPGLDVVDLQAGGWAVG